jgi:hypothetical protein
MKSVKSVLLVNIIFLYVNIVTKYFC